VRVCVGRECGRIDLLRGCSLERGLPDRFWRMCLKIKRRARLEARDSTWKEARRVWDRGGGYPLNCGQVCDFISGQS
jgi:hypothetical protein